MSKLKRPPAFFGGAPGLVADDVEVDDVGGEKEKRLSVLDAVEGRGGDGSDEDVTGVLRPRNEAVGGVAE
jgi:hypothetical protein